MITKASRKERVNMTAAGAANESIVVYTVSSNRTFILTDLVFSHSDTGMGLVLYDSIVATATFTAGTQKLKHFGNPVVITDLQNGPEFERGVSAQMVDPGSTTALPTYGIFIGGFER